MSEFIARIVRNTFAPHPLPPCCLPKVPAGKIVPLRPAGGAKLDRADAFKQPGAKNSNAH
jgi:hypothetical protein